MSGSLQPTQRQRYHQRQRQRQRCPQMQCPIKPSSIVVPFSMCYFSISLSPQLSTSCRDRILYFCIFFLERNFPIFLADFVKKGKKKRKICPQLWASWLGWNGMMGRRSSCPPPIRRTLITYALLCILLYPVFCSSLYLALSCILLFLVFCFALSFALLSIMLFLRMQTSYFQFIIGTSL